MTPIRWLQGLVIALIVGSAFGGAALAQDEPAGGNAIGGSELSAAITSVRSVRT